MGRNVRRSGNPPAARSWQGTVILSYGFRPFFLGAGVLALLAMLNWLFLLAGSGFEPTSLSARDWHVHEMLFGYTSAAIAGFLLTAVPNWTGRMPVAGWPLGALALVWVAGRLAMLAPLDSAAVSVVEALFLPLLAALIGREVIAGRNWRNLRVLAPILLLAAANIWFHAETRGAGGADASIRLGFAAILLLILLIGGRVTPSFTRNWLARQGPGAMPVAFNRFDAVAMATAAVALIGWAIRDTGSIIAALLALAGVAQAVRLSRWAGLRCLGNPLLLVLHVSFGFVPLGLVVMAAAALWQGAALSTAALHLWGIGAIGGMTLAVMTRATLGHTGRELRADALTGAMFALVVVAALVRATAAFVPGESGLITLAGSLWITAFAIFVFRVGPWLLRPRVDRAE